MKNSIAFSTIAVFAITAISFAQKKSAPVEFKKLTSTDIKKGSGRVAKDGDNLTVLYIGKFKDGKVFDANMDEKYNPKGEPFTFALGRHMVISGWDKGMVGAREGMVRKLEIPWKLAYGERGAGGAIPPKTDLVFIVKVLKVATGK